MKNEDKVIFESYLKLLKEGDYADEEVANGMMEERPFGSSHGRGKFSGVPARGSYGKPPVKKEPPKEVDDDHFTWWYDEYIGSPDSKPGSQFEIAAAAWNEAVKRMSR